MAIFGYERVRDGSDMTVADESDALTAGPSDWLSDRPLPRPATAPARGRDASLVSRPGTGGPAPTATGLARAKDHLLPLSLLLADLAAVGVVAPLSGSVWRLQLLGWSATLAGFWVARLYRSRLHLDLLDDLPRILGAALVGGLAAATGAYAIGHPAAATDLVAPALLTVAVDLLLRALAHHFVRSARRRGLASRTTVVLGSGMVSDTLIRLLESRPEYGLRVVGLVDDTGLPPRADPAAARHLGPLDDLDRILDRAGCEVLVIAFGSFRESRVADLLRSGPGRAVTVFTVPRMFELGQALRASDQIGAIPVSRLRRHPRRGPGPRAKRALDVVLASAALVALSPLLLLVAVVLRLESGPGVLFRQTRVGRDGRLFELLKFRTMSPASTQEADTRWSIAADDRLTPWGRLLRRTSVDELPQLWNILRGDMTLVGPRPERPYFVEQFSHEHAHYRHRHRVPVGLTGLAQVSGLRGDTSIDDRARFDNYYIEHWSLWLDLKVLARTLWQVSRARGS